MQLLIDHQRAAAIFRTSALVFFETLLSVSQVRADILTAAAARENK